jgi:SAM-dependent methyltransferase
MNLPPPGRVQYYAGYSCSIGDRITQLFQTRGPDDSGNERVEEPSQGDLELRRLWDRRQRAGEERRGFPGADPVPAARRGARVTGVDIAPNLVVQARERAEKEGVEVSFDEGDAEQLPYEDGSFDLVVTLIGAMFAPRPERVAAELARVCRPGGRIVMGNWTPEGFIGSMFKVVAKHAPPPSIMPSPLMWGKEDVVRERLRDSVADLQMTRRMYPFHYPFSPAGVVEHYETYFGPTIQALARLDAGGQAALRADLEALWSGSNQAGDGVTHVDAELLEVVATRA